MPNEFKAGLVIRPGVLAPGMSLRAGYWHLFSKKKKNAGIGIDWRI